MCVKLATIAERLKLELGDVFFCELCPADLNYRVPIG